MQDEESRDGLAVDRLSTAERKSKAAYLPFVADPNGFHFVSLRLPEESTRLASDSQRINNLDFSVLKNTRVGEGKNLQFRI